MENNIAIVPEYIFGSENYISYLVEYIGEFNEVLLNNPGIYVIIINDDYASVYIKSSLIQDIGNTMEILNLISNFYKSSNFEIVYVLPPEVYTLQAISSIEASQVDILQVELPLNLRGKGVLVGIIDTGIDYLSDEFKDINGKTRINEIWDQGIGSNTKINNIVLGTVYKKDKINEAIDSYNNGRNPYDIVPSRDEIGHGTNMAGIVGATGKNPSLKGVAPECELVIVKLVQSSFIKKTYEVDIPVYNITSIFMAIEYLKNYSILEGKPMVILLPLGTNSGNHKGDHVLDNYIASVSRNIGLAIVTGSGNEGIQDLHTSGFIKNKNEYESIEMIVEKGQKFLSMEVWVDLPNIIEINIIAPSGADTGFIPAILNINKKHSFIFEQTTAFIYYNVPEEYTGDQLIRIYFKDIQPGIWKIAIRLRLGKMATYNAWLLQKGLTLQGTRFMSSNQYGTITIPGDSPFVITVAAYNQNNNNLLAYSGVAFRDKYEDTIDFAAGGSNTITVGIDNGIDVINGSSLAAAIGAGACVLLFEWGIINKNYPYMYSQSIKTFLSRGTMQRQGDKYPNPQLGYGIINFYKIFENML